MKKSHKYTILSLPIITILMLSSITILTGTILSSNIVSADDNTSVVDQINITVPVSCTISGVGMNTHNAEINNGQYNSAVGESSIKAMCNDNEGFAIYAIGYTSDINGSNVLTDATLDSSFDIVTGLQTSGNASQWAMKLSTVTAPVPTYPIAIQNSFDAFHEVPNNYTLVAKRTAGTDIGVNAEGSVFESTYQVYVSPYQPAGTYVGQVKYILIHPNYVDKTAVQDAITVVFDSNGLFFPDGSNTNTIKYAKVCQPGETVYVGNTPTISKTENIGSDGTMNYASDSNENYEDSVTISDAYKLKVELTHGYDSNGWVEVYYDGDSSTGSYYGDYWSYDWVDNRNTFTETFIVDSNTVSFKSTRRNDEPEPDVEYYGYYAKIYPIYETELPNTMAEALPTDDCEMMPISGTYMETTEWHDRWVERVDGHEYDFRPERPGDCEYDWCIIDNTARGALLNYLENNYDSLKGQSLMLYSYNPVTFDEVYSAANRTKVNGYYTMQDLTASMCSEVSNDEIADVIDNRDGNVYSIAKLNNGYCWLRDDLRFDPTDATTAANMSSTNTNASDEAIYNYLNGGNAGNYNYWSSVAVAKGDSSVNEGYFVPRIKEGNYGMSYNYCAATVGTVCVNGDVFVGSSSSEHDVCPKNWEVGVAERFSDWYGLLGKKGNESVGYWTRNYTGWVAGSYQLRDYYYVSFVEEDYALGSRYSQKSIRCRLSSS